MEVLASADEAMPALAQRLAAAPAPAQAAASSAPAVLSRASAPSDCALAPEPAAAEDLPCSSAPAVGLDTKQQPVSEQQAVLGLEAEDRAPAAVPACKIGTDDSSLRQAGASASAPAGGLNGRAMSSAALSESPAALAMPAREDQLDPASPAR